MIQDVAVVPESAGQKPGGSGCDVDVTVLGIAALTTTMHLGILLFSTALP